MEGQLGNISGVRIVASDFVPEKVPAIQLSDKVQVSDEFRKKTNAWLVEMFGYKAPLYFLSGDVAVGNPNSITSAIEEGRVSVFYVRQEEKPIEPPKFEARNYGEFSTRVKWGLVI